MGSLLMGLKCDLALLIVMRLGNDYLPPLKGLRSSKRASTSLRDAHQGVPRLITYQCIHLPNASTLWTPQAHATTPSCNCSLAPFPTLPHTFPHAGLWHLHCQHWKENRRAGLLPERLVTVTETGCVICVRVLGDLLQVIGGEGGGREDVERKEVIGGRRGRKGRR
jgi:hypothetical protein